MKAIIPAAGLGTRLLPATKSVPKALIPVQGKPAIQWALEEATGAGFRDFIIVVKAHQAAIRDFLTPLKNDHPLLKYLALARFEDLLNTLNITFVEQDKPYGLGNALLCCRDLIEDRAFALLLPDNICHDEEPLISRLRKAHAASGKSVVAFQAEVIGGPFVIEQRGEWNVIKEVFPKKNPLRAKGRAGIGRYVLSTDVFDLLAQAEPDGELSETPALMALAESDRLIGVSTRQSIFHLGG